jgi:hypothetical protein
VIAGWDLDQGGGVFLPFCGIAAHKLLDVLDSSFLVEGGRQFVFYFVVHVEYSKNTVEDGYRIVFRGEDWGIDAFVYFVFDLVVGDVCEVGKEGSVLVGVGVRWLADFFAVAGAEEELFLVELERDLAFDVFTVDFAEGTTFDDALVEVAPQLLDLNQSADHSVF